MNTLRIFPGLTYQQIPRGTSDWGSLHTDTVSIRVDTHFLSPIAAQTKTWNVKMKKKTEDISNVHKSSNFLGARIRWSNILSVKVCDLIKNGRHYFLCKTVLFFCFFVIQVPPRHCSYRHIAL
jgi:hypothetical protein